MLESHLDSPPATAPAPSSSSRRGFLMLGALAGAAAFALPKLPASALDLGLASQLKFLQKRSISPKPVFHARADFPRAR